MKGCGRTVSASRSGFEEGCGGGRGDMVVLVSKGLILVVGTCGGVERGVDGFVD